MGDYTPVAADVQAITLTAGAAITGRQLVKLSADDTVIPTAAPGDRAIGAAAKDTVTGERVTVFLIPGNLHEIAITSAGVLAAGNAVQADAAGRCTVGTLATLAAAGTLLGYCVRGGTGNAGGTVFARVLGA